MSEPYTPYGDEASDPRVRTCPCVQCANVGHPLCALEQIRSLRSQLAECQRQLEAERAIQRYGDRVGGRLEKVDGEWVIRPFTPDSPP